MAKASVLNPLGNDLDPFLQASVGDDENGQPVTVLSTLARLGVDPWEEATALTALSADAARTRFSALLATIRDVPALAAQIDQVSRRLTLLLPARPQTRGVARGAEPRKTDFVLSAGWRTLLILVALIVIAQVFVLGWPDF